MIASIFTLALPALASLCSALPNVKRATPTTDITIYAYGKNISSIPLVWSAADSAIYISEAAEYSVLNFNASAAGTDVWNATAVNTTTSLGSLFIIDGAGIFANVGLVASNETLATGATTAGIQLYGSQVEFLSDLTLKAQFWAQKTGVDGVWALKWNSDGTDQVDSVPVVLKVRST